ncbi:MAG: isoleucine--tRNA ligase [Brevinema sp.]
MNEKKSYPVNLPQTKFDMRAGLVQKEPITLKAWEENNIYTQKLQKRHAAVPFIFHDGPPYANGDIHIGTALNKILKDLICRYKYMEGFQVAFIPGWDCHGLPIELNTLKELGKTADSLNTMEIRQKSREYAQVYIDKQRTSFKKLGVDADWENPYLTMSNDYEASIIEAFGKLVKNGYIYRGQRPIYWSPSTCTALADAEVEYHEHTSPSAYVLFPILNTSEVQLPTKTSIIIWTTTPWTLPANTGVAFHPDEMYEAVSLENDTTLILASALKEQILSLNNHREISSKLLSRNDLEKLSVSHPWIARPSKVVFADYVTMDTGTGIVHTAPGHGTDDYHTGLKYQLEILSPVDDEGRFTSEVPEWEGLKVFDANPKIIEYLKTKNLLYFTHNITHSYPHDWRTKTPVIFRTKPQWFFKVSDPGLTFKTLAALPSVQWIPKWGEERIKNMLSDRPDWCISRQRKWGVPIPAFYCKKCEEAIISEELAVSIADRVRKDGLSFWIENPPEQILPKGFSCPSCGHQEFLKEQDILDVWFDSGSSHYAVLDKNNCCPADLYFEGNDQYRGWFQASLWNAMGIEGHPPFKTVLTHGWVLDEQGHQMHKSAGNSISPSEITDKFGADILRLWTVTEDYTKDLRIGSNLVQKTVDLYRKLRNTFRYLLGVLFDFSYTDRLPYNKLEKLDQYILHKLAILKQNFKNYMDHYQFHRAYREIFNFTIIDLSGEYFDILKDRLYILSPNDPARRSAQTVLSFLLEELTLMLAPILVFTSEEVYSHTNTSNQEQSVHLLSTNTIPPEWINDKLEQDFSVLYTIREEALKQIQFLRDSGKIGSSLEAHIIITVADKEQYQLIHHYLKELNEILIVSSIVVEEHSEYSITAKEALQEGKQKCQRCWKIKADIHNDLCHSCTQIISGLSS